MIMYLSMFDVLSIFLHFICMYMFMGLVSRMFDVQNRPLHRSEGQGCYNIGELDKHIEKLVKDPTDTTPIQNLLKEKDKKITTLKQNIKMYVTKHVQTIEILVV